MNPEELEKRRLEFEKAHENYAYWTTGTRCMPGSQTWMEAEARYNAARDAYEFARQEQNRTGYLPERPTTEAQRTKVFVIHGRDERLRKGMFDFLRSLGLQPLEWSHAIALTKKGSPYVGEILDAAFAHAQAVVVMLSPDDEARLRVSLQLSDDPPYEREFTPQARPNVLFEAGMALAYHPARTILVEFGRVRPFSDVAGRHTVRMDNSIGKRQDVAQRLRDAGCSVNFDGTDWHTSGDLRNPAIQRDEAAEPVIISRQFGRGNSTLELRARVAPPDCHKTGWRIPKLDDLSGKAELPCYYFRLCVTNTGQTDVRDVELFAARLRRLEANGGLLEVTRFTPMNLLWANIRQPRLSVLKPRMPKMCDLAHIIRPRERHWLDHELDGISKDQVIAAFDLEVQPNMKGHLIGPGTYELTLVLGAEGVPSVEHKLEIEIPGPWYEDEPKMLSDGFRMRLLTQDSEQRNGPKQRTGANRTSGAAKDIRACVRITSGFAKNFLVEITNESSTDELSLIEISLEKGGVQLTRPARPSGNWTVAPNGSGPFGWQAEPDPVASLVRMNDNKGIRFKEEIEIVLKIRGGDLEKEIRQKKIVKVDGMNLEMRELVG